MNNVTGNQAGTEQPTFTTVQPVQAAPQAESVIELNDDALDLAPSVKVSMHEPEDPTIRMQEVFMEEGEKGLVLSPEKINQFTGSVCHYSSLMALIDYAVGVPIEKIEIHKAYDSGKLKTFAEQMRQNYHGAAKYSSIDAEILTPEAKAGLAAALYETTGGLVDDNFIEQLETLRNIPLRATSAQKVEIETV